MKNKKVLIVGKERVCNYLAEKNLLNLWMSQENIVIVSDGIEALERTTKELFDIIILESRLLGIHEKDLAQQIRAQSHWSVPKIINYTADVFQTKEWFDELIVKPATKKDFAAKILKALDTPSEDIQ